LDIPHTGSSFFLGSCQLSRFQISADIVVEDQVVPAEDIPEDPEPWEDEPTTLEQLLDLYVVEGKCNAGVPGGMIYVTNATRRKEEKPIQCVEGQRYKLFFVTGQISLFRGLQLQPLATINDTQSSSVYYTHCF